MAEREEALRLAVEDGRGYAPIIAHGCLGLRYLAKAAVRLLETGMALCRRSCDRVREHTSGRLLQIDEPPIALLILKRILRAFFAAIADSRRAWQLVRNCKSPLRVQVGIEFDVKLR